MWQAVETSIQTFNKTRRLNMSFKKTATSNESFFVYLFSFSDKNTQDKKRVMIINLYRKLYSYSSNIKTTMYNSRVNGKNEFFKRRNSSSLSIV